ncbi:MAG: hypothetical protein ACI4YB_07240 [Oscillospiraceae bacterium]
MKKKKLSDYYEEVLFGIDSDLASEYETGIITNFNAYVLRMSQKTIEVENDIILVPEKLITREYINRYYEKSNHDISAKDCAYMALNSMGVPPIDEMSIKSLEKTIRDIIKGITNKAYIKRVSRTVNTLCVDLATAHQIISHQDVEQKIQKQIQKAESNTIHKDSVAWRAYEFQKDKIAYLDSLEYIDNETECDSLNTLTVDEKTHLMVKAIFDKLFSDFDFDKYESYKNEMDSLYEDWDFGKRYQELYDIFHTPHYNYEFYKEFIQEDFMDELSDKVVEKLFKKLKNS